MQKSYKKVKNVNKRNSAEVQSWENKVSRITVLGYLRE